MPRRHELAVARLGVNLPPRARHHHWVLEAGDEIPLIKAQEDTASIKNHDNLPD